MSVPRREEKQSTEEAVFVGEQATGTTVIVSEKDGEWIETDDLHPLSVEEYR